MGNMQKYSIDFKLQVVGKYEQGKCGYKRLAREFNLSRDTVCEWCLNVKFKAGIFIRMEKVHRKAFFRPRNVVLFFFIHLKKIESAILDKKL